MTSVTTSSHVLSATSTQAVPASSKQSSQPALPNVKVFDKEPPKDFTGMVPAYFEHLAKLPNGSIAGAIKFLNATSLKKESLADLVKCGQLACVVYDKGVVKQVCLCFTWANHLVEHKASEIVLSTGGPEFKMIKENITVSPIQDESYNNLGKISIPLLMKV